MNPYTANIMDQTLSNSFFRKVLFTTSNMQLVVMSLKPGEDIGEEVHKNVDQFIRIEKGVGKAILDGKETEIKDDFVVVIPKGTVHNIVNTSQTEEMNLYTIYSPANHKDGVIHKTKQEAIADEGSEQH